MIWYRVRLHSAYLIVVGLILSSHFAAAEEIIQFEIPVACKVGRTCYIQNYVDIDPTPPAKDYRCGTLSYEAHNGTDFRLPSMKIQRAGVDVIAATAGRVVRVRDGVDEVCSSNRDATP